MEMAVLRIQKKQQNFLILDKSCLQENALSWGAKGLHAYLMSMADDWRVQVSSLQKCATNGRDAVRGYLLELEKAGYIKKSLSRNEDNGRFGGLEYLVLEISEPKNEGFTPETENPSSVNPEPESPATGNPSTDYPAPDNPPLINIKYNNYLNKQGLNKTAAIENSEHQKGEGSTEVNAAVLFSQKLESEKNVQPMLDADKDAQVDDAFIGKELTPFQKKRVLKMIMTLNMPIKKFLNEEVIFCLLSKKHFTGCENDFAKKLNAIRKVILRGDWQRPTGMNISDIKINSEKNSRLNVLKKEHRDTNAELMHFKKLMMNASGPTKDEFEKIIQKTIKKMTAIESEIHQFQLQEKVSPLEKLA